MKTKLKMCQCGHTEETHKHYRPGSDCGACGIKKCPKFRVKKG